jgi:ABC-type uncharacterized transport system ATPase subunit
MEFVVKTRSKKVAHFLNKIVPHMIDELGLTNSRKFLMIEVCKLKGDKGLTTPLPGLDSIVVALSPAKWEEMGVTLAHEMVHVRQLCRGILRAEKGTRVWMGKKYSKRTKYLDMPWELDAFARQEIVFRKALEKC